MPHPTRRLRGGTNAKNVLEVHPGCRRILDALERVLIPGLRLNIKSRVLESSAQGKRKKINVFIFLEEREVRDILRNGDDKVRWALFNKHCLPTISQATPDLQLERDLL